MPLCNNFNQDTNFVWDISSSSISWIAVLCKNVGSGWTMVATDQEVGRHLVIPAPFGSESACTKKTVTKQWNNWLAKDRLLIIVVHHPASLSHNQHNNTLSYWLGIQSCTLVIGLIFGLIYMIKSTNTIILWPNLRYDSNSFFALMATSLNIPFNIFKINLPYFLIISKWKFYLSFCAPTFVARIHLSF